MTTIAYDRFIGSNSVTGSNQTTTTLTVASEVAPTLISAETYGNLIVHISSPGSPAPSSVATCTDSQAASYTLVKEILFSSYALDIFSRISTTVDPSSTITCTHQASNHRIILADEWYNINNLEHIITNFNTTGTTAVDLGNFHTGRKHWLNIAVLAIVGSPHGDSVSIPDGWSLLHDIGSNYGDTFDIRLVVCYQITKHRQKLTFQPIISTARVWAGAMFAYKQK